MPDPSLDELYEALTSPYTARLSPDTAAAHLLAMGADGPALVELAALTEDDFEQALELLPVAAQEATGLLAPVTALRDTVEHADEESADTLVICWRSSDVSERIDELGDFLDDLTQAAQDLGLGELEGPVDEAGEQVAFCYGRDIAALRAFVLARLVASSLPEADVVVRTRS